MTSIRPVEARTPPRERGHALRGARSSRPSRPPCRSSRDPVTPRPAGRPRVGEHDVAPSCAASLRLSADRLPRRTTATRPSIVSGAIGPVHRMPSHKTPPLCRRLPRRGRLIARRHAPVSRPSAAHPLATRRGPRSPRRMPSRIIRRALNAAGLRAGPDRGLSAATAKAAVPQDLALLLCRAQPADASWRARRLSPGFRYRSTPVRTSSSA